MCGFEGLPDEAWNKDMVGRIIAGRGTVHFVETSSVRRENTTAFNAWVWTRNPAALPRRIGFNLMNSLLDEDVDGHGRATPRSLLEGRRSVVIIHVDMVEDLTALGRAATASSVAARGHRSILGYEWELGKLDTGRPEWETRAASLPHAAAETAT